MSALANLLYGLENKYGKSHSLLYYLDTKYGEIEENKTYIPMFTEEAEGNKDKMKFVLSKFQDDSFKPESLSEKKLIDKFEKDVSKAIDTLDFSNSEKTAKKLRDILKKSILKLWSFENRREWVCNYCESVGILIKNFDSGYKLTDDDLVMLNESLLQVNAVRTKDFEKDYKVIEMEQPIFLVGYEDDDGDVEYAWLEGICKYYIYER